MSISPIFLLILAAMVLAPVKATNARKLTTTATDTALGGGDQFKCGGCPCNQPCYTAPPPPPPPAPKKPSPTPGFNCPPPPSYIYITGPPGNGNLYPVDPYSHSSANRRGLIAGPPLLVVVGLLFMLTF